MFLDQTSAAVIGVIFVGTLVRSTFGFGEALVSVPLLAFLIPVKVAAPVAALASITVALVHLAHDWREVHARSAGGLVLATLFGIPLGLLLLRAGSEPVVKGILGAIIVAFSIFCLLQRDLPVLANDRWSVLFGFVAGIMGGAYGMNGPPLVVYGILRRWTPEAFRATLQGYFLPASLVGMAGYGLGGFWGPAVNRYFLLSLPGIAIAIALGRWVHRRLDAASFRAGVYAALIGIGALLLAQATGVLRS